MFCPEEHPAAYVPGITGLFILPAEALTLLVDDKPFPLLFCPEEHPAAYVPGITGLFILPADPLTLLVDDKLVRALANPESDSSVDVFRHACSIMFPAQNSACCAHNKLLKVLFGTEIKTAIDINGIAYGIIFPSDRLTLFVNNKFLVPLRRPKNKTAIDIVRFTDRLITSQRNAVYVLVNRRCFFDRDGFSYLLFSKGINPFLAACPVWRAVDKFNNIFAGYSDRSTPGQSGHIKRPLQVLPVLPEKPAIWVLSAREY